MDSERLFSSLDAVAAQLPFGLHETDRVNLAYEQWIRHREERHKRIVDLWTYCFVRRYVLLKFAANRTAPNSDLELLIERIYRRIEQYRHTLTDASKYAGWVSVVCRNAYLNHLRVPFRTHSIDPAEYGLAVTEPEETEFDAVVVLDALHAAIERLPPYLKEVARLRFAEESSYEEIHRRLDLPLPVVRAYVSKVLHRFRRDTRLERLLKGEEVSEARRL